MPAHKGRGFVDLTGRKFGRLLALKVAPMDGHKHTRWYCVCECGIQRIIMANSLLSGRTQSCGCFRKEVAAANKMRSSSGGIGCKRRLTADETMAEVFATDPRVLLKRLGIRIAS